MVSLAASTDRATHRGRLATLLPAPGLALQARTQKISPTGSTPPVVAPLLRGEFAILVRPHRDGEHNPMSQQRVDDTTSTVQLEDGMRAVRGGVLHSPEHSSGESSGASAVKTAGSRVRSSPSYALQEGAIDSDGLVKTGFGPTVFLPLRLPVSRSTGSARSKVSRLPRKPRVYGSSPLRRGFCARILPARMRVYVSPNPVGHRVLKSHPGVPASDSSPCRFSAAVTRTPPYTAVVTSLSA